MEAVKAAATFASTVASIAVSASRVLRILASTVAGTSAVGRPDVCVSSVDGASLEQATAVRPEITRTIRMIILIFYSPVPRNYQSSLSTGAAAPGAVRGELPGRRPGQDTPASPAASSPFPSVLRGWGLPAQYHRLRAMPQRWVLACVAEIPKVIANSVLIQVRVPVLVDARVAGGRLQLTGRLALASSAPGLSGGLGIPVAVDGSPLVREVAADEATCVAEAAHRAGHGTADYHQAVETGKATGVDAAPHIHVDQGEVPDVVVQPL